MKKDSHASEPIEWTELGSFKSYLVGFILSILLTVSAYLVVVKNIFTGGALVLTVTGLGLAQMLVQFIFFLHLGKESKPRWNVMVFLFMLLIVAIIVFGSLWIMYNLDYRVMTPEEMQHMRQYEGI